MIRPSGWRQLIVSRQTLALAFLIVVVVFGIAYLLAWELRPDYFVIQQEVNLYPIGSIDSLLNRDQFNAISLEAGGLTELSTQANEIVKTEKSCNPHSIGTLITFPGFYFHDATESLSAPPLTTTRILLAVIGANVNCRQTLLFPVTLQPGTVVQVDPFQYCTSNRLRRANTHDCVSRTGILAMDFQGD